MDDDTLHWTWYHWMALGVGAVLWVLIWYGIGSLLWFILTLR